MIVIQFVFYMMSILFFSLSMLFQILRHTKSLDYVLDVGSGTGVLSRVALMNSRNVISVESDWEQVTFQNNILVTHFKASLKKRLEQREIPDDLMLIDLADYSALVNNPSFIFRCKFFPSKFLLSGCPRLDPTIPYHMIGLPWMLQTESEQRVNKQLYSGWRSFRPFREYGGRNLQLKAKLGSFLGTTNHWQLHVVPTQEDLKMIKDGSINALPGQPQKLGKINSQKISEESHVLDGSYWDDRFPNIEAYGLLPPSLLCEKTELPFIPSSWTLVKRKSDSSEPSFDLVVEYSDEGAVKFKRELVISMNFIPQSCDRRLRQECGLPLGDDPASPLGTMLACRVLSTADRAETANDVTERLFKAAATAATVGPKDSEHKLQKKTDLSDVTVSALLPPERFLMPSYCRDAVSRWIAKESVFDTFDACERLCVLISPQFCLKHISKMVDVGDETFKIDFSKNKSVTFHSALVYTPPRSLLKDIAPQILKYDETWFDMDPVGDDIYLNCYDPRPEIDNKFRYIVAAKQVKLGWRPGLQRSYTQIGTKSLSVKEIDDAWSWFGLKPRENSQGEDNTTRSIDSTTRGGLRRRFTATPGSGKKEGNDNAPVDPLEAILEEEEF